MMTDIQQSNYNYMQTMNADEVAKFKAAIEAANKAQQTTTTTGTIGGGLGGYYNPNPCPTCGHCPTCGRGGSGKEPYWYYPPNWLGNATYNVQSNPLTGQIYNTQSVN